MIEFLKLVKAFLEQYMPAIAVALWNYEENRVDHANKEKEAAQLALRNVQEAEAIRSKYSDMSDDAVLDSIIGADDKNDKPKGSA